jgi:hypothetical protein
MPEPIHSLESLADENLQKLSKADIEANIRAEKLRQA